MIVKAPGPAQSATLKIGGILLRNRDKEDDNFIISKLQQKRSWRKQVSVPKLITIGNKNTKMPRKQDIVKDNNWSEAK